MTTTAARFAIQRHQAQCLQGSDYGKVRDLTKFEFG